MASSPDRIPCCVPFCRRTAPRDKHPNCVQIICGKHWRLAPAEDRRAYRLLYKACDRFDALYDDAAGGFPSREIWGAAMAARLECHALWDKIRGVIIAEAGVSG